MGKRSTEVGRQLMLPLDEFLAGERERRAQPRGLRQVAEHLPDEIKALVKEAGRPHAGEEFNREAGPYRDGEGTPRTDTISMCGQRAAPNDRSRRCDALCLQMLTETWIEF